MLKEFKRSLARLSGRQDRKPKQAPAPLLDWQQLLAADRPQWEAARQAAVGGPKVLLATSVGGHRGVTPVETMLAVALTLRGAEVHFLLCDAFMPACMHATLRKETQHADFVRGGPQAYLCSGCWGEGRAIFEPLGLPIHRYGDLVSAAGKQSAQQLAGEIAAVSIPSFRLDDLAVGEHALAGALRYFARGDLLAAPSHPPTLSPSQLGDGTARGSTDGPLDDSYIADGEAVLRRYFEASILAARAAERLLDRVDFTSSCFHHGIYVPQGLIGEVARRRGVPVVNWIPAYRKRSFIFSHGDTYHHTLMTEATAAWEEMAWTQACEDEVMDYLKSRWYGARDWIWFHDKPESDLASISQEFGIDFNRPVISLLTNVMWDAQLHYPANAFPTMLDWVLQTIAWFAGRPDLQLVIRVHPAEVRGGIPSRQPIVAEIARAYPEGLPGNVFVIPPEHQASTYAIALHSDAAIIYGTKTGVELTAFGIPVIVAGEAWIRNKGVTIDAQSQADYFAHLDRLPFRQRLDEATQRRAAMYAYHFFFRRMVPLSMMEPRQGYPRYGLQLDRLAQLAPGSDLGLDVICAGILTGSPFIYPAETLAGNGVRD